MDLAADRAAQRAAREAGSHTYRGAGCRHHGDSVYRYVNGRRCVTCKALDGKPQRKSAMPAVAQISRRDKAIKLVKERAIKPPVRFGAELNDYNASRVKHEHDRNLTRLLRDATEQRLTEIKRSMSWPSTT